MREIANWIPVVVLALLFAPVGGMKFGRRY
jgi:hypothetical protein